MGNDFWLACTNSCLLQKKINSASFITKSAFQFETHSLDFKQTFAYTVILLDKKEKKQPIKLDLLAKIGDVLYQVF